MNRATEHWPVCPAPDFGGLNGRFADLYARRETSLFWSRFAASAQIALGAVAVLAMVGRVW